VRYELCVAISIVTNCLVKDSPPLTRFPSNIEVQKGRKKPKSGPVRHPHPLSVLEKKKKARTEGRRERK
jgi:hypothetical protein